jgi:hypothetical protein
MIQEQQQLAQEEEAKLKERVRTALAKAIGWAIAARPDLDQADPLPVPTTGETPNSAPEANQNLAAAATSAAAASDKSIEGQGLSMPITAIQNAISWSNSEPQNKFINIANQNMVPQTNPNSVPQTNQNSVPQTSNTLTKIQKIPTNFNVQKRY